MTGCENDSPIAVSEIDYIGFESGFTIGVDPTGSITQAVTIATSTVMNSDRTFSLSVVTDKTTADPSAYTVPSTVIVPANSNIGTFNVEIEGSNVNPDGSDVLVLEFISEEGLFISGPIALGLEQVCPYLETTLDITFDGYGSEVSWELKDSSGSILYSASLGTYIDGQTNASAKFCLSNGSYTFTLNDQFGDGLSFPANGSAVITNNGAQLVNIVGDFGDTISQEFTISN